MPKIKRNIDWGAVIILTMLIAGGILALAVAWLGITATDTKMPVGTVNQEVKQ